MRNDPIKTKTIRELPATRQTFDSGGAPTNGGHFDELASLFTLAHMRSRRERAARDRRLANGAVRQLSSLSRPVSLDDVAHSAKLATGDGGILENERSEA